MTATVVVQQSLSFLQIKKKETIKLENTVNGLKCSIKLKAFLCNTSGHNRKIYSRVIITEFKQTSG